jgi:23S rRNA (pseudouridine1915-N3)-methyltransferase
MIRIVAVGKMKEEWKSLENEFLKRVKKFCKVEIIEIKESKGNSPQEILRKEAEKIEKYLKGFVIVLDEKGKQIDSQKFSDFLKKSEVTFVIGSHLGLHDIIKEKANFLLSLSQLTFSHLLARIILLEQIYRGFCILHNLPYHK